MKSLFSASLAFLLFIISFPVLAQTVSSPDEDKIYVSVEEHPRFPGGQDSLMKFLATNIRYPAEAMKNGENGLVVVNFIIDPSGSIKNPEVIKNLSPSLDAEALRVIGTMPIWSPGRQLGKAVSVKFTLPIRFAIKTENLKSGKIKATNPNAKWKQNKPAQFPSGEKAMEDYFTTNIKYPPNAFAKNVEGTVIVSFKISKTGELSNFKVENTIDTELSAEALRVMEAMPNWEPAVDKGYKVTTRMVLEIPFVLTEKPAPKTEREEEKDPVTGKMVKKPGFPGGEEALMRFLSQNMTYPKDAQRNGIEGVVILNLLVDSTGLIKDIKLENEIHASLEAEARRVVASMPKWLPGEIDGKPEKMNFTLPLRFSIR